MSKKLSKKTIKPKENKGFGIDPKWKKQSEETQSMDGLGVSFEEAMKILANPNPPDIKN